MYHNRYLILSIAHNNNPGDIFRIYVELQDYESGRTAGPPETEFRMQMG